ncbi:alpha/beta fold hydrolase [Blastococcus sp. SYSU D00820]
MADFVLQHGAWHGGWAWQPVAARLRAAGHRVSTVTSPGLGVDDDPRGVTLADCVDALVAHVEAGDRRGVTLVGHSWGGYVVAGAAPRLAGRLERIVFWSAFVPEAGRSLVDEVPPPYRELFASLAGASDDDTVTMPLEVFQNGFMNDAAPETAAVVHSVLRPQPYRTFTDEPVGGNAYRELGIPLDYLYSTDDVALPPGDYAWTPRFPDRLGATVTPVPGSHESMFTRPAELADGLLRLATGA